MWKKVLWSDETDVTPSPQRSMVLAASCCGDVFTPAGNGTLVSIQGITDGANYR